MDFFLDFFVSLHETMGPGLYIILAVIALIGIIAQWALYEKCGLPGVACIVPVWNVIVFLRIMGRPASHIFLFLIPIYNIYFLIKVYMELCNCFGKNSYLDYFLVIVLNGFYVFYLGLSESAEYLGPVYKRPDLIHQKMGATTDNNTSTSREQTAKA